MTYATTKNNPTLSTKQAADMLACSVRTIRYMIDNGELRAYRMTTKGQSHYRISLASVQAYLLARQPTQT